MENNLLRIAIQAKGRLNEDSMALLRDIGIRIDESKRKFLAQAPDFPLEVLYLRDDDIPQVVAAGTADLGIVGLNEVAENSADGTVEGSPLEIIRELGFGQCRISLAVPKAEPCEDPAWFNGKRIATSYPNILRHYLAGAGVDAVIEVIAGSVEVAPAAGISDAIFDIVSSGGTLVSNGLKEVEKVFHSQAVLVAAGKMPQAKQPLLDELLFRIDSALVSRRKKYLVMNLPQEAIEQAVQIVPAMRSPTIMPLAAQGWYAMHAVIDEAQLWEKIRQLKAIGAEGILVLNTDKIIP
ncbi:MAG: ATP phosphoribosyltransferase [Bacteroidales bacterium]|nr:ATP phosphoribosyltransferase [Bacteroidales bacterium]